MISFSHNVDRVNPVVWTPAVTFTLWRNIGLAYNGQAYVEKSIAEGNTFLILAIFNCDIYPNGRIYE